MDTGELAYQTANRVQMANQLKEAASVMKEVEQVRANSLGCIENDRGNSNIY